MPHIIQIDLQIFEAGAEWVRGTTLHGNWQRGDDVVVKVDGNSFRVGAASGTDMNCLIDALKQVVGGGIDCDVEAVRN